MKNRLFVLAVMAVLLALVLLGCTMGRSGVAHITATPTKTLRPMFTSTFTPIATLLPADTPVPTDTPVTLTLTPPPTEPSPATDTPIPPTELPPSDTPIPPTDTPALPTDTLRPRPTNTPVPPKNTPKPQLDFVIVKQDIVPKAENVAQLYTIFVRVEDAAGNPLNGLVVWDPSQPAMQAVTGDKPDYYHAEILMGGGDYYLEVKDARSEKTKRLTTVRTGISNEDLIKAGYCMDDADCNQNVGPQHFSWHVVFRRTW